MGIVPEGAKNPEALGRAMLGAGLIATLSGAPILPVGITGTEKMGNWLRLCYPKGQFRIIIGEPFTPPPTNRRGLRKHVESVTDTIMENIASLLPERLRGVYHENWEGERGYTSPPDWWKTKLNNAKQND
jgi:1-acyl-sn-glycerol-3-phosphate acyltransferase